MLLRDDDNTSFLDLAKRAGYTFARGVPQIGTGLIDLFGLPFTMTGMIKPEDVFGSTDYVTKKGFLPTPEMGLGGLLGETGELLSSAISPAAAAKTGILALGGGLVADAARLSGADLTPAGAIKVPKGLIAEEPGITAYHGSPYDFDKFQLDKIGTGEGAQAFGHGLYFTDSEDIAKFYKEGLGSAKEGKVFSYKGDMIDVYGDSFGRNHRDKFPEGVQKVIGKIADNYSANYDLVKDPDNIKQSVKDDLIERYTKYIADEQKYLDEFDPSLGVSKMGIIFNLNNAKQMLKEIKEVDVDSIKNVEPKTYEVAITPKVSQLIDYDKPLGEQNQFVKDALKKVVDEMNINDARNLGFDDFDFGGSEQKAIDAAKKVMLDKDKNVLSFLNDWAVFRGNQGAGEELLQKHGVRGIKYLDNNSRNLFGAEILGVEKNPDGMFRAKVVLDDPYRITGMGGTGSVITTSKPYKTKKEAQDWAENAVKKETNNYVIFDDKDVNIKRKYELGGAGLAGLLGYKLLEDDEEFLLGNNRI